MASEQHDTVFPEEDQDLDDDEESSDEDELEENDDVPVDGEEDDEEELNSASIVSSVVTPSVTVAFPSASAIPAPPISVFTVTLPPDNPDPKPLRVFENVVAPEEKKPVVPLPLDESRRLFQRLWTDEDEIELLQGFLDYTSQRGNAHHHDTALFYDQIKSKLQVDFNKNQLVEKLRRLKKKYRNVTSKISSGKDFTFKTAHDQATFEISRKIWSTTNVNVLDDEDANANHNNHANFSDEFRGHGTVVSSNNHEEKNTPKSRKRPRAKSGANENVVVMNNIENVNVNNNGIAGVVEETVRSCLSPLFKELLGNVMGRGIGGLAMSSVMPLGFVGTAMGLGGGTRAEVADERWRKQQILELEVYSKRLELVQDQIKMALEELRSMGG